MKLNFFLIAALFFVFFNCFSQEFTILDAHYKGNGKNIDYSFTGTLIIKDNSLFLDCDKFLLEAKITIDSNNFITYQCENKEYKLQIIEEKGYHNNFFYDFLLITRCDDEIGGVVMTYYCRKN